MKHLANFIRILPLTDFESFDGTQLIGKSGAQPDLLVSTKDLTLEPKPGNSSAGTFYTEELQLVSDKLTETQQKKYCNRRPVIALLYDDSGNPILWGDADQRLRVVLTPGIDADILDFSRKTTKKLF